MCCQVPQMNRAEHGRIACKALTFNTLYGPKTPLQTEQKNARRAGGPQVNITLPTARSVMRATFVRLASSVSGEDW